MKQKTERHSFY